MPSWLGDDNYDDKDNNNNNNNNSYLSAKSNIFYYSWSRL